LEKFEAADDTYKLDFIFNKTVETLQFAQDNIPYYQKVFKEHGFSAEQFKHFDDLKRLPFLTKPIIQKEIDNLYTDKFDKPVAYFTGGSSSTPMKMYAPLGVSRAKEKAYSLYSFEQLGYKYRDRTVALRGKETADPQKGIYWDYEMVDNYLQPSGNYLEAPYIEKIVEEIKRFKPKYFYGYPSNLLAFMKACKLNGIEPVKGVQGIFLISESVFPHYIDELNDFFKCPVLSHYGHTERNSMGYKIDHKPYHFFGSYGLTRIVDDEIITLSFDNIVMPYINYKTQDYTEGEVEFYEGTDIVKSLADIRGRIQEYLVTKDESVISVLSIGAGHYNSYDHVDQAQFYQDTPGKAILFLQSEHPEKVKTELMKKQMEDQVKNVIDFEIKFKDKIEKSKRGKRILVVQKLDVESFRKKRV
jgi:phenylacetate-CoA ligase